MPLSSSTSVNSSFHEVKQYSRIPQVLDIPHLILMQLQSFERLKGEGIRIRWGMSSTWGIREYCLTS